MQSCRFTIETEDMKNFNERYPDFDVFWDIEILAEQPTWCMIRTYKLLPTLMFMQEHEWRLWDLQSDDEEGIERNILTYYKKQPWKRN